MPTSSPRVAIVDYGMGNLYSVQRACEHVGLESSITTSPDDVRAMDGVILPGVGSMPDAMRVLETTGLADAIREVVERGTPFLGVCLGLQLLMTDGSEFGAHSGLGIIPGRVERLAGHDEQGAPLKVPHIGWNAVNRVAGRENSWADTPLDGVPDRTLMYFVHSYRVIPADPAVSIATTQYGDIEFCSAIAHDRIFACQFHPERSGPDGLGLYARFAATLSGDDAHSIAQQRSVG